MGLTSWKNFPNGKIIESDVVIAKNYLSKDELRKFMNFSNIEIENYVVVNNELIKISPEVISLSKNLKELTNFKNSLQSLFLFDRIRMLCFINYT